MRRLLGLLACVAALAGPGAASAQDPSAARNTHTRMGGDETTLTLSSVRLIVPRGTVARGSVIGLGVGGVPAGDGSLATTGIVVTAEGGLRAPLIVLIPASLADQAVAVPGPALINTADGTRVPCQQGGGWIACRVPRPGAYVVGGTSEAPPDDPELARALAGLAAETGRDRPAVLVVALVVVLAAAAGGAVAVALGGRGQGEAAGSNGERPERP